MCIEAIKWYLACAHYRSCLRLWRSKSNHKNWHLSLLLCGVEFYSTCTSISFTSLKIWQCVRNYWFCSSVIVALTNLIIFITYLTMFSTYKSIIVTNMTICQDYFFFFTWNALQPYLLGRCTYLIKLSFLLTEGAHFHSFTLLQMGTWTFRALCPTQVDSFILCYGGIYTLSCQF